MDEVKMDGKSLDITKMNIETLKELFPDVVEEGKIDFDKLRAILGDEVDSDSERYNFTWHGKNQAIRISQTPSMGTLRPCIGKSVDWDNTNNIYIEGDNLEVLKLLQKSYFGKIKMIYIDPPYNTGNDFVYEDNFSDNLVNYKQITSQIDSEGRSFSSNTESDGRFHTNWLNMIYPRLRLARNLLSYNGVIFISIDDNELDNLLKVGDEIFGRSNRLAILVWKKKYTGGKGTSTFADYHEYIVSYAKNINLIDEISMARPDSEKGKFTLEDEYIKERGRYYTRPLKSNLDPRPTLVYPIELPDGNTVTTQWICAEETFLKLKKEGRIEFKSSVSSKYPVYKKFYENDGGGNIKIPSFLDISSNNEAKEELKKLFDIEQTRDLPFPTPKPTKLLRLFVDNFVENDDIVLDFFSGSASLADAIMQTNADLKKSIHYIMVQLPENYENKLDGTPYHDVCEFAEERIRRAGSIYRIRNCQKTIDDVDHYTVDVGFRVFSLDSSNIKKWSVSSSNLQSTLLSFEDNLLLEGRTDLDVIYELVIKLGLPLTTVVEHVVVNHSIYSIGYGALMVCLDDVSSTAVAEEMIELYQKEQPEIWKVVFKDNGFSSDSVKANVRETLKAAGLKEDCFLTL